MRGRWVCCARALCAVDHPWVRRRVLCFAGFLGRQHSSLCAWLANPPGRSLLQKPAFAPHGKPASIPVQKLQTVCHLCLPDTSKEIHGKQEISEFFIVQNVQMVSWLAQQVKGLCCQAWQPTQRKERTSRCALSSDLHVLALAHTWTHLHTCIHTPNSLFKKKSLLTK